eukprot:2376807-Rhodomonas_salina.1
MKRPSALRGTCLLPCPPLVAARSFLLASSCFHCYFHSLGPLGNDQIVMMGARAGKWASTRGGIACRRSDKTTLSWRAFQSTRSALAASTDRQSSWSASAAAEDEASGFRIQDEDEDVGDGDEGGDDDVYGIGGVMLMLIGDGDGGDDGDGDDGVGDDGDGDDGDVMMVMMVVVMVVVMVVLSLVGMVM